MQPCLKRMGFSSPVASSCAASSSLQPAQAAAASPSLLLRCQPKSLSLPWLNLPRPSLPQPSLPQLYFMRARAHMLVPAHCTALPCAQPLRHKPCTRHLRAAAHSHMPLQAQADLAPCKCLRTSRALAPAAHTGACCCNAAQVAHPAPVWLAGSCQSQVVPRHQARRAT